MAKFLSVEGQEEIINLDVIECFFKVPEERGSMLDPAIEFRYISGRIYTMTFVSLSSRDKVCDYILGLKGSSKIDPEKPLERKMVI